MKQFVCACLMFGTCGMLACSHDEPQTEKIVVERERIVPQREVTVERRSVPTFDGGVTEERVVRERVVPKTEVQRTITTTTNE